MLIMISRSLRVLDECDNGLVTSQSQGVIETYSTGFPVLRRNIAYQSVICCTVACHLVRVISDVNSRTINRSRYTPSIPVGILGNGRISFMDVRIMTDYDSGVPRWLIVSTVLPAGKMLEIELSGCLRSPRSVALRHRRDYGAPYYVLRYAG